MDANEWKDRDREKRGMGYPYGTRTTASSCQKSGLNKISTEKQVDGKSKERAISPHEVRSNLPFLESR